MTTAAWTLLGFGPGVVMGFAIGYLAAYERHRGRAGLDGGDRDG